jgi:hypothetical protein
MTNNIVIPDTLLGENLVPKPKKPGDPMWIQFWNKVEVVVTVRYTGFGCPIFAIIPGGVYTEGECNEQDKVLNLDASSSKDCAAVAEQDPNAIIYLGINTQ